MSAWDLTLLLAGAWLRAVAEWFEDVARKLRELWGGK